MFLAIQQGYYQKAIEFIENAEDVNIRDRDGMTPLIICTHLRDERKAVGIARALLSNGARVSHRDSRGLNALHYSCIEQLPVLVEVLLAALDCDVNVKCRKTGNTALHFSTIAGNQDALRKLVNHISRYEMNIDVKNHNGDTALQLALRLSNNRAVNLLVSKGANAMLTKSPRDSTTPSAEQMLPNKSIFLKRNKMDPLKLRDVESNQSARICRLPSRTATKVQPQGTDDLSPVSSESSTISWRDVLPFIWTRYTQQTR